MRVKSFLKLALSAAVVLAGFLVSGIAIGTRDAAAAVKSVSGARDLLFGDVAGDADLAGTVVISPASGKTVTGGATNFGQVHQSAEFVIETTTQGGSYLCTLPSSFQVTAAGANATVDTFTSNLSLAGNVPPGIDKVSIFIGATLHLAAGQAAGDYQADFSLTCEGFLGTKAGKGKVFAPISISATSNIDFGTMIPTGTAGTVTVTPAGARSSVDVDLLGGTPAAASFDATGASDATYSIILPSSATLSSGANTMTVDTFTDDAGASPTLTGGSDTFNVGATLNVGATQAAGTYSGTFAVTVNYN